jgi:hypothetical protein
MASSSSKGGSTIHRGDRQSCERVRPNSIRSPPPSQQSKGPLHFAGDSPPDIPPLARELGLESGTALDAPGVEPGPYSRCDSGFPFPGKRNITYFLWIFLAIRSTARYYPPCRKDATADAKDRRGTRKEPHPSPGRRIGPALIRSIKPTSRHTPRMGTRSRHARRIGQSRGHEAGPGSPTKSTTPRRIAWSEPAGPFSFECENGPGMPREPSRLGGPGGRPGTRDARGGPGRGDRRNPRPLAPEHRHRLLTLHGALLHSGPDGQPDLGGRGDRGQRDSIRSRFSTPSPSPWSADLFSSTVRALPIARSSAPFTSPAVARAEMIFSRVNLR